MSKYKVTFQNNGKLETIYLEDIDNLPNNTIDVKKTYFSFKSDIYRIDNKKMKHILDELSMMLDANVLFNSAIDILIKNRSSNSDKEFLKALQNCFINSKDIEYGLKNFKIDPIIKSFLKIIQKSSDMKSNIKALSIIVSTNYDTKQDFIKVLIYPIILFITFLFSIITIFNFVVPRFISLFDQYMEDLPFATIALLSTQQFFENYFVPLVLLFFLFFTIFFYFYKTKNRLKFLIDLVICEYIFLVSDIYKSKQMYVYFVALSILLKNRYDLCESMRKSKVLLKNQYLLDRITNCEKLLQNGKSVYFAFETSKIFDDIILSLISAGESSNSIEIAVYNIENLYKKRFDNKLKLFSILLEPIFFVFIVVLILWIILALFVPLWDMSNMIRV